MDEGEEEKEVVDVHFPPEMDPCYNPSEEKSVPEFSFSESSDLDNFKAERNGFGRVKQGSNIEMWGDFKAGTLHSDRCVIRVRSHSSEEDSVIRWENVFKGSFKDGRVEKGTVWFSPKKLFSYLKGRFDFRLMLVRMNHYSYDRSLGIVYEGRQIFSNGVVVSGLFEYRGSHIRKKQTVILDWISSLHCQWMFQVSFLRGEMTVFDPKKHDVRKATLNCRLPFYLKVIKTDEIDQVMQGHLLFLPKGKGEKRTRMIEFPFLQDGWLYDGGFRQQSGVLIGKQNGRIIDTETGKLIWKMRDRKHNTLSQIRLSEMIAVDPELLSDDDRLQMLLQSRIPNFTVDIGAVMHFAANIDRSHETEKDGLDRAMKIQHWCEKEYKEWKLKRKFDVSWVIDSGANIEYLRYQLSDYCDEFQSFLIPQQPWRYQKSFIHVCCQYGLSGLWDLFEEEHLRLLKVKSESGLPHWGQFSHQLKYLDGILRQNDAYQDTPIHYACSFGQQTSVQKLMELLGVSQFRLECCVRNRGGQSALELCALNQHWDLLQWLLDKDVLSKNVTDSLKILGILARKGRWTMTVDLCSKLQIRHRVSLKHQKLSFLGNESLMDYARRTLDSSSKEYQALLSIKTTRFSN